MIPKPAPSARSGDFIGRIGPISQNSPRLTLPDSAMRTARLSPMHPDAEPLVCYNHIMLETIVDGVSLLPAGAAVLVGLAAVTTDLMLLAQVWQPFIGGRRALARRLPCRFGSLEIGVAATCAMVVALPAALAIGQTPLTHPQPPSSVAAVLLPAAILYAIWIGTAVCCAARCGYGVHAAFFTGQPSRRPLANGLGLGVAAVIPVLALSILSFTVCKGLGLTDAPQDIFTLLREPQLDPLVRVAIIAVAIVGAPIAEEFLFRGLLFPALLAHTGSFTRALVLQGLLFGAIHAHLATVLPLSAAGIFFALGYAATGSLLTPIAMHMVFNASSILLFLAGG